MPTELIAFKRIQKGIDTLISIHGSETAASLIEAITLEKNSKAYTFTVNLQKLIEKQVVETFRINQKLLSSSNDTKYKEARKCCFYLLKKHCDMSAGAIKKQYPKYLKTRNNIASEINQMLQIVELPQINKKLYEKFVLVEQKIVDFKK